MKTTEEIVSSNLVYCITVDLFGSNVASFGDAGAKHRKEGRNYWIKYSWIHYGEESYCCFYIKWKFNLRFENRFTDQRVCLEWSMKKMKTFNSSSWCFDKSTFPRESKHELCQFCCWWCEKKEKKIFNTGACSEGCNQI